MAWETTSDEKQAFAWNRASWDERVAAHWASKMYRAHADALRAGTHDLDERIVELVGDVRGRSLIHLQCHMGMETLAWSRLGADAVGLDFSEPAIEKANLLREELGLSTRFVCANVYDALDVIREKFDVVFVSVGSLCWLPDSERWARIVSGLLNPGGRLFLNDTHPMCETLADAPSGEGLVVAYPYFHEAGIVEDCDETYADGDHKFENVRAASWTRPIGEVVTSVIKAGLQIECLEESPRFVWPAFDQMRQIDPNLWELNEPWTGRLPASYTLMARRPDQ
ncbi:MAG: class I SAM-dependent methyltransferase [Planctomycetota bacterium]